MFLKWKNILVEQKADLDSKLKDFERKGNHWLELIKNWIIDANQSENLAKTKNFPEMRNFLKTVGSNRILLKKVLRIDFEKQYQLLWNLPAHARATGEGEISNSSRNTIWWSVLDSARTHFRKNPDY